MLQVTEGALNFSASRAEILSQINGTAVLSMQVMRLGGLWQALAQVLCKTGGHVNNSSHNGGHGTVWDECRLDAARALANLVAHDAENKRQLAAAQDALAALVVLLRGGGGGCGDRGQAAAARAFFNLVSLRQARRHAPFTKTSCTLVLLHVEDSKHTRAARCDVDVTLSQGRRALLFCVMRKA